MPDLDRLLARLARKGDGLRAGKGRGGRCGAHRVAGREPVALDYRNFRLSPKGFFLPQNQTLLRFKDWTERRSRACPSGRRSSSASGRATPGRCSALDKVFLDGDQHDPYYARLREKTTVIALACARPMSSCFCTSVGGGPGDGTGADVLAVALATDLLLRPQTPKGEACLSSAG